MKYYSEITRKKYDTVEALEADEKKVAETTSLRAKDAKEVEQAIKEAYEAEKRANDKIGKFIDTYGSFKTTMKVRPFDSVLDSFFDMLW